MRSSDFVGMSLRNVFAAPLRTALTILGMAIGIGAILAVLTLGDAGKVQVQSEMTRLGIDKVWLTASQGNTLRTGDAALLAEALDTTVTEQAYVPVEVAHAKRKATAVLVGCTADYLQVMDTHLLSGRCFYPSEWRYAGHSVVLGPGIAQQLAVSPGDYVSINGFVFCVCGIVQQRNEVTQIDPENALFLPVATFCDLLGETIHEITLTVPKNMMPQTVATMAESVMHKQRGVQTSTVTMQVQIEAANSVIAIFVDVLKWVALVCILVGGIGVMNILLVSVRERRREIGIMKAMGTTKPQIRMLFLLEALFYALLGGVFGIVFGIAIVDVASRSIGLSAAIRTRDCVAVSTAALGIGLFFGVVPASRAASLKPVDALRDD